jgi:putative methyltransferase (TIGR04325 family)
VVLRTIAVRLLPPVLTDAIRHLRRRQANLPGQFEVVGPDWPEPTGGNPGWEDPGIATAQAERWPAFVSACSGTAPLDVAHEAVEYAGRNMAFHNTYMSFGYVLARAEGGRGQLSMLDWGGGLGHYAVLAGALMPGVDLEYHCKDLPAFVEQGERLLPGATFHSDDACLGRTYDLVMASGSLQCSRDWREVASGLAGATGRYLYVTRLPVMIASPSMVVRQHARVQGFNDDLLGWFINREELVGHVTALGLRLVREFYVDEYPHLPEASEQPDVRGFLFSRA